MLRGQKWGVLTSRQEALGFEARTIERHGRLLSIRTKSTSQKNIRSLGRCWSLSGPYSSVAGGALFCPYMQMSALHHRLHGPDSSRIARYRTWDHEADLLE